MMWLHVLFIKYGRKNLQIYSYGSDPVKRSEISQADGRTDDRRTNIHENLYSVFLSC